MIHAMPHEGIELSSITDTQKTSSNYNTNARCPMYRNQQQTPLPNCQLNSRAFLESFGELLTAGVVPRYIISIHACMKLNFKILWHAQIMFKLFDEWKIHRNRLEGKKTVKLVDFKNHRVFFPLYTEFFNISAYLARHTLNIQTGKNA